MPRESVLTRVLGQFRWSLQQRGLVNTLRTVAARLLRRGRAAGPPVHPFDLEHGTDTSGLIGSRDLRTGHAHDVHTTAYFGTPPSRLRHAVKRWQLEAGVSDPLSFAFFDLGCGKGRALMVASTLGFREVAGVELNAGLAAIARSNLERWRVTHPDASPVEVTVADASEAPLPEGPLLIYLYNSFGAPVLRKLLQRIVETRARDEPPLYLLYLYPEQAAVFADLPQFQLLWTGTVPLDPGELLDGVSTFEDPCSLYHFTPSQA